MQAALFVSIVCTAVQFSFAEDPKLNSLTIHNKGIGGQNSQQGRARFQKDVLDLKPDHLFIYFGLNDTLNEPRFLTVEKFIENLSWMIDQAREAKVSPILCTIHSVKEEPLYKRHKKESYGTEGPNGKINRYNDAIRKLAAQKKVPLADWAKVVADAKQAGVDYVSSDGVHLTVEGSRALAKCLWDVAGKAIKPKQTIVCLGDSVTFGAGMKGAGTATGQTYPAVLREFKLDQ